MKTRISAQKVHSDFVNKIKEISGQNILLCYQCGMCSATCPLSFAMDIPPRKIMRLIQLGIEEDISNSNTIWLCASCLTCVVRCPRGVDLAKVMEALRLITLRKNIDYIKPAKISPEAISEFPQLALVSSFRKHTA